MEVARSTRATKRSRREIVTAGDRPRTRNGRRARGQAPQDYYEVEEEDEEQEDESEAGEEQEQQRRQQRGRGRKRSLPNLAVHFAELTNAILRRLKDEGTSDQVYDDFIQGVKQGLIYDLKRTYNELQNFYASPSTRVMPNWLSVTPPTKAFYTLTKMDPRLLRKDVQIKQNLRVFLEELGFVCPVVEYSRSFYVIRLRLDVATDPTTKAQQDVQKRLLTLDRVLEWPNVCSGP